MNKEIAESIRLISQGLGKLADALTLPTDADTSAYTEPPVETEKPKRARKKKSDDEQEAATVEQAKEPEQTITHEKLREFLGNLASNGHSDDVASLLKEYGKGKLSTVPEDNYQALYAAAQKVGDDNA